MHRFRLLHALSVGGQGSRGFIISLDLYFLHLLCILRSSASRLLLKDCYLLDFVNALGAGKVQPLPQKFHISVHDVLSR